MQGANLIFDMGLHKGEDTDFFLRKGFRVVAFEANPVLIDFCRRRFEDHISRGQLRIIEGAVAPRSAGASVQFFRNVTTSVWGTIDPSLARRNDELGSPSEIISLPRVDVSEAFEAIGIPFYLKIDLEGVDRHVLECLSECEHRPQYLSIETEKVDFAALQESLNFLAHLGYKKFKIVQQATVPGSSGSFQCLDGSSFSYVFSEHASGPFGEDIPQPWISLSEALKEFNAIFQRYRWFGDDSMYRRLPKPVRYLWASGYKLMSGYRGRLPGWHDIHASL